MTHSIATNAERLSMKLELTPINNSLKWTLKTRNRKKKRKKTAVLKVCGGCVRN